MEMASEPYELQPLGMDSFVPPSIKPDSHTRLDNIEPVQNTGYMVYPARPEGGMHPSEPRQLVNNYHNQQQQQQQHHHQLPQQQQQQQQHGSLVTDSSPLMPLQHPSEPGNLIPEHSLPPQNTYIMSKPDIMNNSTPPVGSNESLTLNTPPPGTPNLSERAPSKHSTLAVASAKSRRKHDRVGSLC